MEINNSSFESIKTSLQRTVEEIMISKSLKINEKIFGLIDLEVYYFHFNHPDTYALGVNHDKEIGELEAHRYGIDISLGNKESNGKGGILICSLYDFEKTEVIHKPSVPKAIFNNLVVGKNTIEIIPHETGFVRLFQSKRLNLGSANDDENKKKFVDQKLKFLVAQKEIFEKYKNKEKIFRKSNLSQDEITELLGYKLPL